MIIYIIRDHEAFPMLLLEGRHNGASNLYISGCL